MFRVLLIYHRVTTIKKPIFTIIIPIYIYILTTINTLLTLILHMNHMLTPYSSWELLNPWTPREGSAFSSLRKQSALWRSLRFSDSGRVTTTGDGRSHIGYPNKWILQYIYIYIIIIRKSEIVSINKLIYLINIYIYKPRWKSEIISIHQ